MKKVYEAVFCGTKSSSDNNKKGFDMEFNKGDRVKVIKINPNWKPLKWRVLLNKVVTIVNNRGGDTHVIIDRGDIGLGRGWIRREWLQLENPLGQQIFSFMDDKE